MFSLFFSKPTNCEENLYSEPNESKQLKEVKLIMNIAGSLPNLTSLSFSSESSFNWTDTAHTGMASA